MSGGEDDLKVTSRASHWNLTGSLTHVVVTGFEITSVLVWPQLQAEAGRLTTASVWSDVRGSGGGGGWCGRCWEVNEEALGGQHRGTGRSTQRHWEINTEFTRSSLKGQLSAALSRSKAGAERRGASMRRTSCDNPDPSDTSSL
ncbi:unnamed protein product [Pleuronectes platessa]|uniref:Uncharacterized protein n=1 Tax=Pleuronectes platessa TaxID=8262 RepID=A0A9N7VIX0_PLEPL|nr:unnamed protein product [Pleuronectes platessa]